MEQRLSSVTSRIASVAAILVAALAILGCSSDSDSTPTGVSTQPPLASDDGTSSVAPGVPNESEASATTSTEKGAPTDVPVAASFRLSADDDALLRYAESILTARCMTAKGFEYAPYDLSNLRRTLGQAYRAAELTAFPYDTAREGTPYSDTTEETIGDPNLTYMRSLDQAQLTAYGDTLQGFITDRVAATALGVTMETPRAGCVSEARAALYGDLKTAVTSYLVAANLGSLAHATTRAREDVQAALNKWISCMSGVGFELQDFSQARQLAKDQPDQADLIASSDAACTARSDLSAVYRDAYADAITELVEGESATFEEIQDSREAALARATSILAGE